MKQFFAIFQSDYARTVHTAQGETHRRTFLDVRPRHSPASEGQSFEGIIQPTLGMPWDGGTCGLEIGSRASTGAMSVPDLPSNHIVD